MVVAADPLARASLARALATAGRTLSQTGSGAELEASLAAHRPDVLLWDLGLQPEPALERLAELLERPGEHPPVVALVGDPEQTPDALAAGARGAVGREADDETLSAALEAAARGLAVLEPALLAHLLDALHRAREAPRRAPAPGESDLTPREHDVLQLLAEGLSNKLVGARLGISDHTAKFHVNQVFQKLGVTTRTEAVVRAARLGLVTL